MKLHLRLPPAAGAGGNEAPAAPAGPPPPPVPRLKLEGGAALPPPGVAVSARPPPGPRPAPAAAAAGAPNLEDVRVFIGQLKSVVGANSPTFVALWRELSALLRLAQADAATPAARIGAHGRVCAVLSTFPSLLARFRSLFPLRPGATYEAPPPPAAAPPVKAAPKVKAEREPPLTPQPSPPARFSASGRPIKAPPALQPFAAACDAGEEDLGGGGGGGGAGPSTSAPAAAAAAAAPKRGVAQKAAKAPRRGGGTFAPGPNLPPDRRIYHRWASLAAVDERSVALLPDSDDEDVRQYDEARARAASAAPAPLAYPSISVEAAATHVAAAPQNLLRPPKPNNPTTNPPTNPPTTLAGHSAARPGRRAAGGGLRGADGRL